MTGIRPARFRDIPEITRLAEQLYRKSVYAGRFEFEPVFLKRIALETIRTQSSEPANGLMLVSDTGDGLDGMFAGYVRRLYECMDAHIASNSIWYVAPKASPLTGIKLIRAFEDWLSKSECKTFLRLHLADAVEDPNRMSKVLSRAGFRAAGLILEKEI